MNSDDLKTASLQFVSIINILAASDNSAEALRDTKFIHSLYGLLLFDIQITPELITVSQVMPETTGAVNMVAVCSPNPIGNGIGLCLDCGAKTTEGNLFCNICKNIKK